MQWKEAHRHVSITIKISLSSFLEFIFVICPEHFVKKKRNKENEKINSNTQNIYIYKCVHVCFLCVADACLTFSPKKANQKSDIYVYV